MLNSENSYIFNTVEIIVVIFGLKLFNSDNLDWNFGTILTIIYKILSANYCTWEMIIYLVHTMDNICTLKYYKNVSNEKLTI